MYRYQFAAALLSLAVISPASAKEEPTTFTHDGVTYTYTVTNISESRRLISGTASPGSPFQLVVTGGRVDGLVDDTPVHFKVSEAKGRVSNSEAGLTVAAR